MNLLSDHIGSLFHQHRSNPGTKLSRHRDDSNPRTGLSRVSATYGGIKVPKLSILANCRPGGLDEFASQPSVSRASDRAPISFLSRRVLSRNHSQKACKLADVLKLAPIADTSQELARHDPADATNTHHVLDRLRQFRIVLTEFTNLFGHFHNLLLRKLHIVQQLIEFEAHALRALKFSQLALNDPRPSASSGSRWESDPFEE